MNELSELSKALALHQKALAELEAVLKDVRRTVFGVPDEPFPYPEADDEESERRALNRRAYRKPYDWMTELED
jgi:hypothetical protein